MSGCRSCGNTKLESVLSLGRTPLANALLTFMQLARPEATYPLELVFCSECSLVQLAESVSPEKLFRDYVYLSSFSDTMLQHAEKLSTALIGSQNLDATSLVVEVASNDGYLLQFYKRSGVPVLGIEPATNIAEVAEEKGITTVRGFFNDELAVQLVGHGFRADVIHAHNVLAHVPELIRFVQGMWLLLKHEGVIVVEVPYVYDMIAHCEFDTIYHEHVCYFSLTALNKLFTRCGLTIQRVEQLAIHGGSLRIYAGHEDKQDESVTELLADEKRRGVLEDDF